MSEPFSRQYNFFPSQQLAKWLCSRDYIWQKKILTADELGRLATDLDVQFSGKEVCQLWELGPHTRRFDIK